MKWVAIASLFAAAAAGFMGWQQFQALQDSKADVARLNAQVQSVQAEARKIRTDLEAAKKETSELKLVSDQLRSDANSAKTFLEAERAMNLKLREDLASANERIANIGRSSRQVQSAPPPFPPMIVRQAPLQVRSAGSGSAVGAAQPAR